MMQRSGQPFRAIYNRALRIPDSKNRSVLLFASNNGDRGYGIDPADNTLLSTLFSWHTENALGDHSRLFPLPLGPGLTDAGGGKLVGAAAPKGSKSGDASAGTSDVDSRLALLSRIRNESIARWPSRAERPILAFMEHFGAYFHNVNSSKPPGGATGF